MKIVKPINVTDDILINSSIPMPDASMGEEEWQNEGERFYSINAENQQVSIFPNDSIYVSRDSADISSDVFLSVSKSGSESLIVSRFSSSGGFIASSTQSISRPATWHIGGISKVGRVLVIPIYTYDNESWEVEFIAYDLKLNIFGDFSAGTNFSPDLSDFGSSSRFNIKAGAGTVAVIPKDFTGQILVFNYSGSLIATSRVSGAIDFFVDEGVGFYILLGNSGFNDKVEVLITDSALNVSRSISVKLIGASSTSSARINYDGLNVSLVTLKSTGVMAFVYDKNMINIGSYKRNDEVIKSSTKRKYRCAVDATFDDPELGVNLSPPTWVDIGAVNRWMPFDKQPSQQAVSGDPMYYKLKPGEFVRTLSIFNISRVSSINVKVTNPADGVIYDKEFDLVDNSNVVDMWTYLTLPISFKKELIITDLVCFRDSEIEITINGNEPAVGAIVAGNESPAGRCVTGTGVRSNQFSIRKENGFGGFDIIQRGVGKIVRFRVDYDISQIEYLTNLLESIDSVYCVFIGDLPNGKTISVYGVLDPYQSDFETPTVNTLEFDVLGVL